MDFNSKILNCKSPSIRIKSSFCRYKTPKINKPESLGQIKEILQKYIDSPLSKADLKAEVGSSKQYLKRVQVNNKKLEKSYFNDSLKKEKPILFDAFSIHCKSPTLKLRKFRVSSMRKTNNCSLIVQKASRSRYPLSKLPEKPPYPKHTRQNSSYSSYSDIYKHLLEKLPLK